MSRSALDDAYDVSMSVKAFGHYRATLRSAVRGLWGGDFNWLEFFEAVEAAVRSQFPLAWKEGAQMGGIEPTEMSDEEKVRLEQEIVAEIGFIARFADYVEAHSKTNGGKLAPLFVRAELWANGYTRITELARTYAHDDPKLKWNMHPAEHCRSCKRLDGRVKRASYWRKHNVYPKAWDKLECKTGCHCTLDPTTERATPGPLPGLP